MDNQWDDGILISGGEDIRLKTPGSGPWLALVSKSTSR
jgi:hypothetical protein